MKITENAGMAIKNLQNNLVRSLLTMLGVIIGVTAVIVMVSLGEGAKQQVTSRITAMGSNLIMVFPGSSNSGQRGGSFGSTNTLTNDLLPIVQNSSPYISAIAPEVRKGSLVKTDSNSVQSSVIGSTVPYFAMRNFQIGSGSLFTEDDVKGHRRVAVLGSYLADELFPNVNPVGKELKIGTKGGTLRVNIVGVLQEKGQSGFGNNDDLMIIPVTTMQQRITGNKYVNTIYVQSKDEQYMDTVYNQIYDVLDKEFKDDTKFALRNQAEILATVLQTTQSFTLLLAGIAAVSLLVGGIGIMNIMLVSVTERIREIGIRKAIGAQKEEILALFLMEAVALSVTGGVIGIILGWLLSIIVGNLLGWGTIISLSSVLISFLFSIMTGLFFGVYPAYKAAGLRPIDALRSE
jgi:putative ABC transport system permease protein